MKKFKKEESTFLYKDSKFEKPWTIDDLENVNKESRVRYAYDGNNGDKWIIINWSYDYVEGTDYKQKEVSTVLGINISQNHFKCHERRGYLNNYYKNANEFFDNIMMPENALDLVKMMRNIRFLSW